LEVIDPKTDWLAKQDALEKATARLQITEEVLPLAVPGHTIGEAVGVSKNSQNHGATQYLFSGDGNGKLYKLDLNGNLLGWAQTSEGHGQNGCLVHEIHCESDTVIYKGDCSTWTVEKITIKGGGRSSAQ
jgi:Tfp pilus tip-associated adhesin PilY1